MNISFLRKLKKKIRNIAEILEIMVELQQEAEEKGKDRITMEEIEQEIDAYRKDLQGKTEEV